MLTEMISIKRLCLPQKRVRLSYSILGTFYPNHSVTLVAQDEIISGSLFKKTVEVFCRFPSAVVGD